MKSIDPISLALLLAVLALIPLLLVVTSSFLKLSVVMMIVRNAIGVQQVPPNIALYGLSLVLTLYIMSPVFNQIGVSLRANPAALSSADTLIKTVAVSVEPLRAFLKRNAHPNQKQFFLDSVKRMWPPEDAAQVSDSDFLILMPAFVISELNAAFQIGFLLYLPFVVIDLVVSNILLALGMMMVSPTTISLPLKLFLFVMVDGWTRMLQGLVLSYA
ncbi:MAG: type III secretion system export apparatus subunit SctR [Pseudomonadota bacterium]